MGVTVLPSASGRRVRHVPKACCERAPENKTKAAQEELRGDGAPCWVPLLSSPLARFIYPKIVSNNPAACFSQDKIINTSIP